MPCHPKKRHHLCRTSGAPDPLVAPGNPPHRHQARPPARPARSHHRMVVVAARPPGPSSSCSSQACIPQKKNATVMLGERESGTSDLQQSIAAYRAALQVYTRERTPLNWAVVQTGPGTTLARLALQLHFVRTPESIGHYESGGHGWLGHRLRRHWSCGRRRWGR
jgi:hypothetical protein